VVKRARRSLLPANARRAFTWLRARSGHDLIPLAMLFLVAAALFAFGKLAEEMLEGDTRSFDEMLLRALRTPGDLADPIGPWWVETIFRDLTSLGSTTVLTIVTLGAIGFLLIDGKRAAALFVLAAIAGGALVSTLLKNVFARPRPELVAHLVDVRSLSFPSGHAMLSAVTFLTLGAVLARVQSRRRLKAYLLGVAVLLTLLVGISRVYLGVHWPTDVLAGWCAGAAWAMGCWLAAAWLQRRGQVEGGDGNGRK
jgi:undecaprenyl-diphosphatase